MPGDARKEQPLEITERAGKKQVVLGLLQTLQNITDIAEMRKRIRKQFT